MVPPSSTKLSCSSCEDLEGRLRSRSSSSSSLKLIRLDFIGTLSDINLKIFLTLISTDSSFPVKSTWIVEWETEDHFEGSKYVSIPVRGISVIPFWNHEHFDYLISWLQSHWNEMEVILSLIYWRYLCNWNLCFIQRMKLECSQTWLLAANPQIISCRDNCLPSSKSKKSKIIKNLFVLTTSRWNLEWTQRTLQ